ncbi:MAG: endonuclease/exonuclease/phosphatase family protein [Bacteroidales bacterium]|nr:endonuclease/exonuclease/phosphatase family protein [Bacteroidales bacterium]
MKRIFLLAALFLSVFVSCGPARRAVSASSSVTPGASGQDNAVIDTVRWSHTHVIGFYNLENLFDTFHDEGKNDYEYLPDGSNQWTEPKYRKKLSNMAHVIAAMKADNGIWHTVLGVSEIENRHVLEDLVVQPEITPAGYQIVHYDSPDRRGVDVALLYRPDKFTVLASESIPFTFAPSSIDFSEWTQEEMDRFLTRDVLMVRGLIEGEMFAFFVTHLPSRLGGKGADLRPRGAEIIYQRAMELQKEFPGIKIAVMGDMNDNPTDISMTGFMHGRESREGLGDEDFFSPFLSMYKDGYSSLYYRGEGNIYDIILVNKAMVDSPAGQFTIRPLVKGKYYGRVFSKPFMTNQEGQYKGTPYRTFSGGAFIGGYSDHYPTYIVIQK